MAKILVAEDDSKIRQLLMDILFDAGYDVIEGKNGGEAFEKACQEHPDLILLDVSMPVMDGFEVLTKLRETPGMEAVPVVMLTAHPAKKGELPAWRLGAKHYIEKPFYNRRVVTTVRVALREAEKAAKAAAGVADDQDSTTSQGSASNRKQPDAGRGKMAIRTGFQPLDQILDGGIPFGSLTLIEGTTGVGKSVLCQHITCESLLDGYGVTYFTSDSTPTGLIAQMNSIGLKVSKYQQMGKLHIYPLQEPTLDDDCEFVEDPERLMKKLALQIERAPKACNIIIADAITDLASNSEDKAVLRFFSSCKRLCNNGKAIILVAQSHAFEDKVLSRLRDLCDSHFSLRSEKMGTKTGTMLEVSKASNSELNRNNMVGFEVQSEVGICTLPFTKMKV